MKNSDTSKNEFEKAEKPEARKFAKKFDTSMIVYIGVLTAMEIVLNRFLSINAWNLKIGFSFVPVAIAGMLFGPIPAAIVAALGDFVGALVFPIGPYFPGFTFTAFLTGIVFGFFLKGKTTVPRVLALDLCPVRLALSAASFDENRSVCGTHSCRDYSDPRVRTCFRQSGR